MKRILQPASLPHALRRVQTPGAPRDARDWDVVGAAVVDAVRRVAREVSQDGEWDELIGVLFMRVRAASKPFEGSTDGEVRAYLATAARRLWLDEQRRNRRQRVRRVQARDDDDLDPVDQLPAPVSDPVRTPEAQARLESTKDRLRAFVDRAAARVARAADRQAFVLQALACILAVLEKRGAAQIGELLGVQTKPATIHKWTERGRPKVLEALSLWQASEPAPEEAEVVAHLLGLFSQRRADAGRERPARRKAHGADRAVSPAKNETSVQERRSTPPSKQRPTVNDGGDP